MCQKENVSQVNVSASSLLGSHHEVMEHHRFSSSKHTRYNKSEKGDFSSDLKQQKIDEQNLLYILPVCSVFHNNCLSFQYAQFASNLASSLNLLRRWMVALAVTAAVVES